MSSGSTGRSNSATWRRWLALELQRLRSEAGLSMQQVADRASFSKGRVSQLETRERLVRDDDLDQLLPFFGVPEDERAPYYEAAHGARTKGWWERQAGRALPDWFTVYVGLEQGASKLSIYEPLMVSGLFQTPEYASAVVRGSAIPRTEAQVERIVRARLQRQDALLGDTDPVQCWLVLTEAALRNVVGDAHVTRAQLLHLAELAERPNVTVQVIPFADGIYIAKGAFAILDFDKRNDPGLVYLEYSGGSMLTEQDSEIDAHRLDFQHLCAQALPRSRSADLIRQLAEEPLP